jgi:hypothetical protein
MSELSFDTVESAHAPTGFVRGDVVKMYKEDTKLQYPCIMLSCDSIERFRVDALKGILGHRSLLSDESMYSVYVNMLGQVVQIGVLPNTRLKSLLGNRIFDIFAKRVHPDDHTTVEGDMLYALCMTTED